MFCLLFTRKAGSRCFAQFYLRSPVKIKTENKLPEGVYWKRDRQTDTQTLGRKEAYKTADGRTKTNKMTFIFIDLTEGAARPFELNILTEAEANKATTWDRPFTSGESVTSFY